MALGSLVVHLRVVGGSETKSEIDDNSGRRQTSPSGADPQIKPGLAIQQAARLAPHSLMSINLETVKSVKGRQQQQQQQDECRIEDFVHYGYCCCCCCLTVWLLAVVTHAHTHTRTQIDIMH